jgi:hypothetical protein
MHSGMLRLNLNPGYFGAADPVPDPDLYPDSEWEWNCQAELKPDIFQWAKSYEIYPGSYSLYTIYDGNCKINSEKPDDELKSLGITQMSRGRCLPFEEHNTLVTKENGPGTGDNIHQCLGEAIMTPEEVAKLKLQDYEEYILNDKNEKVKGTLQDFCKCPEYPSSHEEMTKFIGDFEVPSSQTVDPVGNEMSTGADENYGNEIDWNKAKFLWRGHLKEEYTLESQVKALVWVSEFRWNLRC